MFSCVWCEHCPMWSMLGGKLSSSAVMSSFYCSIPWWWCPKGVFQQSSSCVLSWWWDESDWNSYIIFSGIAQTQFRWLRYCHCNDSRPEALWGRRTGSHVQARPWKDLHIYKGKTFLWPWPQHYRYKNISIKRKFQYLEIQENLGIQTNNILWHTQNRNEFVPWIYAILYHLRP